jgi:hypothetical protein
LTIFFHQSVLGHPLNQSPIVVLATLMPLPPQYRPEYPRQLSLPKKEASRLESSRRNNNRNNPIHQSRSPTAASTMASTKKSPTTKPTGTKRKSETTAGANKNANKKTKNTNTPPSKPATSQQQHQTPGSSSFSSSERTARAQKRGNSQQESDQKALGTVPRKKRTSETVASTKETTEQDKIAATTDEKVDPQDETKDPEDDAAKPTKVPTDPGAPADMSDDKSDGANLEEKQTTERKGNNIDDELQAEAGKKNSSPPHAEIANNTDNQSQSSDSDEAFFSSLEEVISYFAGVDSHQDNWFQSDELPAKHRRFYETF